jgi:hypothetical protein
MEIPLTQEQVAIVDNRDYSYLMQWKWQATKDKVTYYAVRTEKGKTIYMHRVIMNTPKHMEVDHSDHSDHNGLHCNRSNMTNCTHGQNVTNSRKISSSGYRGVYFNKRIKKFACVITINSKSTHYGYFTDPIIAAQKYDRLALKYHGNFAILNFPN